MHFIESLGLDEHLLTLEQTMDTGLSRLGTLLAFELGGIAGKIIGWLFVRCDISFIIAQNNLIGHHRDLSTAARRIHDILRDRIPGGVAA
jgi:hypothetical protein